MRPYGYRKEDYSLLCPCCYYNDKAKEFRRAAKKRARRKWKKELRNDREN